MATALTIPAELAALIRARAIAAGYANALEYLRALVTSDARVRASDRDKFGSLGSDGRTKLVAALQRFEGLAPADFRFDRDQANER